MKPAAMILLFVILLIAPDAALAKVPWHTVEILPPAPVAGQPVTIILRFWNDAGHNEPATSWHEPTVLELASAAGRVPLTLIRTGDGTFQGEVTLAEGRWRLGLDSGYADVSGPADYELATFTVAATPESAATVGAAVMGVALITLGIIWRGRRSPSPIPTG